VGDAEWLHFFIDSGVYGDSTTHQMIAGQQFSWVLTVSPLLWRILNAQHAYKMFSKSASDKQTIKHDSCDEITQPFLPNLQELYNAKTVTNTRSNSQKKQ